MYYPKEMKFPKKDSSFKKITETSYSNPIISYIDLTKISGGTFIDFRKRLRLLITFARIESFFLRNVVFSLCPPNALQKIKVLGGIKYLREINNFLWFFSTLKLSGAAGQIYSNLSNAFGSEKNLNIISLLRDRLTIEQHSSSYMDRIYMTILMIVQIILAIAVIILTLHISS